MSEDARDFNGDFCPVCKAHYSEECEDGCDCDDCLNRMERQWEAQQEGGMTRSERASVERESMVRAQRLK